MLLELSIENYAVVERLTVRFHLGLNVLTGETGSGKSIVVDALGLLFGGRASADMLRTGAERARVSSIFELPATAIPRLQEAGIEVEGDELIVAREILASGKSRAWVGSWPVPIALLRDLAPHLGDIHGQHDQQRLFSHEAQLALLDSFAGLSAQTASLGELYREWKSCETERKELDRTEQERLRLLDLWRFQSNEIDGANLKPGEEEELETERRVLQNVGRISEGAAIAYAALYDAPDSTCAQIRVAAKRLEELRRFDEELGRIADLLKPAEIAIDEAASELRDYASRLEADPDRQEEVESRLAAIDKLKRKYGATVAEILAFGDEVRANIEATENASERRAAVQRRQRELASEFENKAGELTARRTHAAKELGRQVEREVRALAMDRAVFEVRVEPAPWCDTGADAVQFLVSANAGEVPRSLDKVASGGELSRIALSVKTCVTSREARRTLVFDEVDAGIGGTAADSVGRRLKALAAADQVLCVTHLAQIAGYADHHYSVEKREAGGRTSAAVQELQGSARTHEISRMLSGRVTPEALKHAEQLLRSAG